LQREQTVENQKVVLGPTTAGLYSAKRRKGRTQGAVLGTSVKVLGDTNSEQGERPLKQKIKSSSFVLQSY